MGAKQSAARAWSVCSFRTAQLWKAGNVWTKFWINRANPWRYPAEHFTKKRNRRVVRDEIGELIAAKWDIFIGIYIKCHRNPLKKDMIWFLFWQNHCSSCVEMDCGLRWGDLFTGHHSGSETRGQVKMTWNRVVEDGWIHYMCIFHYSSWLQVNKNNNQSAEIWEWRSVVLRL